MIINIEKQLLFRPALLVVASIIFLTPEFGLFEYLPKRRGCAQPQGLWPQLINYTKVNYVRHVGLLITSRSSDPRGDPV